MSGNDVFYQNSFKIVFRCLLYSHVEKINNAFGPQLSSIANAGCYMLLKTPIITITISTLLFSFLGLITLYSIFVNIWVVFLLLHLLIFEDQFFQVFGDGDSLTWNWQSGKLAALQDVVRAPSLAPRATRHVATLTEVCNNEEVPEVEIVSLLQEHIPKYRLRADSLTQFGGYENQDWYIPSPALQLGPDDLALTPDQIRETLNYFLLCSNRVSQMTKTYNDIEAVTRLLEEKEKDLELTARIGKELLAANGRLEARVTALEGELRTARDHITQLRHDLHAKSDLLQVLTNDTEEGADSPDKEDACAVALRKRTGALERENRALRDEAARLAAGADSAELAERQLLRDIAQQLTSANSEAHTLGVELSNERERAAELQHHLDTTTARLTTTERNLQQLTAEHEHTLRILEITRENQNALAAELADTKERYAEIAAHLAEAQEQLRALRKRAEPARGLMPSVAAAAGLLPSSLYREMHSSMYSDLSLDSGISDPLAHSSMQKVFETVQCASRWSGGSLAGSDTADVARALPPRPRSDDSLMDDVSEADSEELYPGGTVSGVPGAPGAAELAAALRRLTPAEIDSRRASLSASHAVMYRRNTDRDSSLESAVWGAGGGAGMRWRGPHKLQIVKPLEGSITLHTWAQLAKPTMSGLLEDQEGVGVRGARTAAALGLRTYRLSDVEEDDDMPRFPHSSHVYTITNSTVLHPNDGSMPGSVCGSGMSSLASSVFGSAWSSQRTSLRSSAAGSPTLSRRESFSVPARAHYSPTATPTNSPLLGGSPDSSPPPTPVPSEGGAPSLHALIASGASMLRRTFMSSPATDSSSPAPLALQTPGSLYTGLMHRSPMEQLTCLKRTLRSPAGFTIGERSGSDTIEVPLGVPAQPGSGALNNSGNASTGGSGGGGGGTMRRGRPRAPRPRTDLGTVGATATNSPSTHSSPLGTLSSLLFGRKGGLL